MIQTLELPSIIVSRSSLGTINHTIMTYECLRMRQIEVLGFFLNRFPRKPNLAESTNAEIIASVSGLDHLGSIPEMGDFFSQQDVVDVFTRSIQREKLIEVLCE